MREASDYSSDEIWLFSVEGFHKELAKFNLKVKAENAEIKAEQERQEQINRATRK